MASCIASTVLSDYHSSGCSHLSFLRALTEIPQLAGGFIYFRGSACECSNETMLNVNDGLVNSATMLNVDEAWFMYPLDALRRPNC